MATKCWKLYKYDDIKVSHVHFEYSIEYSILLLYMTTSLVRLFYRSDLELCVNS